LLHEPRIQSGGKQKHRETSQLVEENLPEAEETFMRDRVKRKLASEAVREVQRMRKAVGSRQRPKCCVLPDLTHDRCACWRIMLYSDVTQVPSFDHFVGIAEFDSSTCLTEESVLSCGYCMIKDAIVPFNNPHVLEWLDGEDPAVHFVRFTRLFFYPFCYSTDALVGIVEDATLVAE